MYKRLIMQRLSSAPATPSRGYVALYWKDSDGLPYYKTADGIEHPFIAGTIRYVNFGQDNGASPITAGTKGSIQVGFSGTIIGWSLEADVSGDITIEIDKAAGTQTVPVVPNTTTDKISASAPITLSAQQTNGVGTSGVSSWTTSVSQYDSIQWVVTGTPTVNRVIGWIAILT